LGISRPLAHTLGAAAAKDGGAGWQRWELLPLLHPSANQS